MQPLVSANLARELMQLHSCGAAVSLLTTYFIDSVLCSSGEEGASTGHFARQGPGRDALLPAARQVGALACTCMQLEVLLAARQARC